jgi:hypothetical protein
VTRVLTSTPSGGASEVLETLHYFAGTRPVEVERLVRAVARRYGGAELDAGFSGDVLDVLDDLAGDDLVTEISGIDDTVAITSTGRVTARAARPRARYIRG